MRKLTYIFILVFFIAPTNLLLGQEAAFIDSTQIKKFIENPDLNKIVKDFYLGRLNVSDNDETFELLELITSKNEDFFPIYFNTLNKIVQVADGALAEIMSEYCLEMIFNYPVQTFNYFATDQDMLLEYSRFLGYEFYFKKEGTSDLKMNFNEFKSYLKTKLDLENETINKAYNDFLTEAEITMNEMN